MIGCCDTFVLAIVAFSTDTLYTYDKLIILEVPKPALDIEPTILSLAENQGPQLFFAFVLVVCAVTWWEKQFSTPMFCNIFI